MSMIKLWYLQDVWGGTLGEPSFLGTNEDLARRTYFFHQISMANIKDPHLKTDEELQQELDLYVEGGANEQTEFGCLVVPLSALKKIVEAHNEAA